MKYLKKFELFDNKKPKIGDYVLIDPEFLDVNDFFKNNIGKIIEIKKEKFSTKDSNYYFYIIQFDKKVPDEILKEFNNENYMSNVILSDDNNMIIVNDYEIKYFANTKEKLKLKKDIGKFNL